MVKIAGDQNEHLKKAGDMSFLLCPWSGLETAALTIQYYNNPNLNVFLMWNPCAIHYSNSELNTTFLNINLTLFYQGANTAKYDRYVFVLLLYSHSFHFHIFCHCRTRTSFLIWLFPPKNLKGDLYNTCFYLIKRLTFHQVFFIILTLSRCRNR